MQKLTITDYRESLLPLRYEWVYEQWLLSVNSSWSHTEVQMKADVQQWATFSEAEQRIILGNLLGFTKAERHVGCYWRDTVCANFPAPEIETLASLYSAQEGVHMFAYKHLETSLGIDTEPAFMQNVVAQAKLANFTKHLKTGKLPPKALARSLAIFSGICERVSLFGSFAILLNMSRDSKLRGMAQILSWSARDEDAHGATGIRLYHELVADYPEAALSEAEMATYMTEAIEHEIAFIANAFSNGAEKMRNLTMAEAVTFIKSRANDSMEKLGFSPMYEIVENPVAEWFYAMTQSTMQSDFFAYSKNGSAYAPKCAIPLEDVDVTKFALSSAKKQTKFSQLLNKVSKSLKKFFKQPASGPLSSQAYLKQQAERWQNNAIHKTFDDYAKPFADVKRDKPPEPEEIDLQKQLVKLKADCEAPKWLGVESYKTLLKGYLGKDETPAGMYKRIASTAQGLLPELKGLEDALFDALFNGYLSPSSPVAANFGKAKNYPVSCYGFKPDNSIDSIFKKAHEAAMLSKKGGGLGNSLDNLLGISPATHFASLYDVLTNIINQSNVRRGQIAQYLSIEHPDILAFLNAKDLTVGDHRSKLDCNIAVTVPDSFMNRLYAGDADAKELFIKVLKLRMTVGSPYLFFIDNANKRRPTSYILRKLLISHPQLCAEIMLYDDADHTYTCVLSSENLDRYDEWRDKKYVLVAPDIGAFEAGITEIGIFMLDAVNQEFINKATGQPGMECSVRFANKSRALGLGVLGYHSYMQSQSWPIASQEARDWNKTVFSNLRRDAEKASRLLAKLYGEPEWATGTGMRNTHLLAIAPTLTNSVLCNAGSPGIEPVQSNAFIFNGAKASALRKNKYLTKVLEATGNNTPAVWQSIQEHDGSVQHLADDVLSKHDKEVFLTALEIDQFELIAQTAVQQDEVDQGLSRNVYLPYDADAELVWELHLRAHQAGLKSLYYVRSTAPLTRSKTLEEFKPERQAIVHIASRPDCIYCTKAKKLLADHGIEYTESHKAEGRVPIITYNGEQLEDGYNSLKWLLEPKVGMVVEGAECSGCDG